MSQSLAPRKLFATPKLAHRNAAIEYFNGTLNRQMSTLTSEWNLSLHLTSQKVGLTAQHVLNLGYTPEIINQNFDLLDIEPQKIDRLILSHAHRDHFGGLVSFVVRHRA